MTDGIAGKVVVLTGATGMLGAATARQLAAGGARLIVSGRRVDALEALVSGLPPGSATAVEADVTDAGQVQRLIDRAIEVHGRIDVLINNAGVTPTRNPEDRIEVWDSMIDVNIKGVLYGVAAALPHMKAQRSGHIINISSVSGHVVRAGSAVYSATKAAVLVLSEGFRKEVNAFNIRTTVISPGALGFIDESLRSKGSDAAEVFAKAVLFAMAQPEEVDVNEILFRAINQPH